MEWLKIAGATAAVLALVVVMRLAMGWVPADALPWPTGIAFERPSPTPFQTIDLPKEKDWVLIIGGSGMHYGFTPDEMHTPHRIQTRARGYVHETAYAMEWSIEKSLVDHPPTRVVWGLGMLSLVDRTFGSVHPCYGYARRTRPSDELDRKIRPCQTTRGWKPDPKKEAKAGFFTLREPEVELLVRRDPWFGMKETTQDLVVTHLRRGVLGLPPPPPPPPAFSSRMARMPHLRQQTIKAWTRLGLFSEDPFDKGCVRALSAVHDILEEAGIPLTIVSMPRHSEVRAQYDPRAVDRYHELLETYSDDTLDLIEAVPDSGMWDHAHPNDDGRIVFTRRLQRHLRTLGH